MKGVYQETTMICQECDRKFSGKNEKMVIKLMKLHCKKSHNIGAFSTIRIDEISEDLVYKAPSHQIANEIIKCHSILYDE